LGVPEKQGLAKRKGNKRTCECRYKMHEISSLFYFRKVRKMWMGTEWSGIVDMDKRNEKGGMEMGDDEGKEWCL
jgi:hypothetical protein